MKHGKNPTRAQREYLRSWRLNPDNWLIIKNTPEGLIIQHRHSEKTRTVPKRTEEE